MTTTTTNHHQDELHLQNLLRGMDIPSFRKENLPWLHKNLEKRNADNENYEEAMKLIEEMMLEKNLLKHK